MSTECPVFTEVVFLGHELIKDEPDDDDDDDVEIVTSHDDGSSVEVYPMDLLKLGADTTYMDHDTSDVNDPEGNTSIGIIKSSTSRVDPSEEQWQKWVDEFDWLLHDPEDGPYGYCFYCNSNLCIKNISAVNKHDTSVLHNEQRENYLLFERSEAEKTSSAHPVAIMKNELCKRNVTAMKSKRLAQKVHLDEFNWSRWLQAYDWLERFQTAGAIGFCRFCEVKVNVEFGYLRERHQNSFKHQESHKRWTSGDRTTTTTTSTTAESQAQSGHASITQSDLLDPNASMQASCSPVDDCSPYTDDSVSHDVELSNSVFEMLSLEENEGRCTVCDVRLHSRSLRKHLKTKLHTGNVRLKKMAKRLSSSIDPHRIKMEAMAQHSIWEKDQSAHPWLQADPEDPSFGYCKYCQKRLMYGGSMSKRLQHENSLPHKAAEMLYRRVVERNALTQEGASAGTQVAEPSSCRPDASSADKLLSQVALDHSKKSRILRAKRGSSAWFRKIPYIQRLSSSRNFVYCSYCDVRLSLNFSRYKHEQSARHKQGERRQKAKQAAKMAGGSKTTSTCVQPNDSDDAESNESNVHKASNGQLSQRTHAEEHTACQQDSDPTTDELGDRDREDDVPAAGQQIRRGDSIKDIRLRRAPTGRFLIWKKRFPWLIFNRKRDPNYVYCRYCETFIYAVKVGSVRRHEKTLKHLHSRNKKKKLNIRMHTETPTHSHVPGSISEYSGNIDQFETESPDTPWLMLDRNCKTYGYCKYCNVYLKVDGISKETHELSESHRRSEETFKQTVENTGDDTLAVQNIHNVHVDDDDDNDDDDVVSIRSEPIEVKDSSPDSSIRQRNVATMDNEKLALKGLTPTQMELFRLMCGMNDRNDGILAINPDQATSSKILSSLSIATWLANLMQPMNAASQHSSQEAASATATPSTSANTTAERNTFDLFFESVSESVKKLPADLAAEGKIKVMKIIYDLEVRALQRKENTNESPVENSESPTTTTNNC